MNAVTAPTVRKPFTPLAPFRKVAKSLNQSFKDNMTYEVQRPSPLGIIDLTKPNKKLRALPWALALLGSATLLHYTAVANKFIPAFSPSNSLPIEEKAELIGDGALRISLGLINNFQAVVLLGILAAPSKHVQKLEVALKQKEGDRVAIQNALLDIAGSIDPKQPNFQALQKQVDQLEAKTPEEEKTKALFQDFMSQIAGGLETDAHRQKGAKVLSALMERPEVLDSIMQLDEKLDYKNKAVQNFFSANA